MTTMNISMKREQNDASISSAERENQRSLAGGKSKFGTKFKTFRLFSMAALALVMAACSNDDNVSVQKPARQQDKIPFTAIIAAPNSGATTRTTYTEGETSINVAWKAKDTDYEGDQIALIHGGKMDVVTVTKVNDDGSAVIEGDITAPTGDEEDVVLVYPAATVESATPQSPLPYTPSTTYLAKGFAQDGTLDYIQNNLDGRQGTGKIVKSGTKASLKENVSMPSKIAIWKLTLLDNAATPNALSATAVNVIVGTTPVAAAASATGKSVYYLCLVPATMGTGDLTIAATVGSTNYTYTKAGGVTLSAGHFYQSTVTMAPPAPSYVMAANADDGDVGKLICTDGHIHYGWDAECKADRVAMIAYMGSATDHSTYKHGLAIALTDEGEEMNWSAAKSACEGKIEVTSAEWVFPSQNQWKTMFKTFGGDDSDISGLNTAICDVGGEALPEDHWYWSSTEAYPGEDALFLKFNESYAYFDSDDEDYEFAVRACLAF